MTRATDTLSSDLIGDLTTKLAEFFQGHRVTDVKNPWDMIADGFLLRVQSKRGARAVHLDATDFGLSETAFATVEANIDWGRFLLINPGIDKRLASITVQARKLISKWGIRSHWGWFVPLHVMPSFKEDWAVWHEAWTQVLTEWQFKYEIYRAQAEDAARSFATHAEEVAMQVAPDDDFDATRLYERLIAQYPAREEICDGTRFGLTYDVSFLPTPQLLVEQAAATEHRELMRKAALDAERQEIEHNHLINEAERIRLLNTVSQEELKHAERLRIIEAEHVQLRADLASMRDRLITTVYRGYAVKIRQRMYHGLTYLMDAVKRGKFTGATGASMKRMLDEVAALTASTDEEMAALRELAAALPTSSDGISHERVTQQIMALGNLLTTEIILMGEQPRRPNRKGESIPAAPVSADLSSVPLAEVVQRSKRQLGIDTVTTLGESLLRDASTITLPQARRAAVWTLDAEESA